MAAVKTAAAVKTVSKPYTASIKLVMDVGVELQAISLEDAVIKANTLKVSDIIDFKALNISHNDSERPDVYGVFRDY